jgi:ABC-2 type transport system permease protein
MKTVLTLFKKDFKIFFKDPQFVSLTFLVPMVLILIFGSIMGGSGSSGPSGIRLLIVNEAANAAASELIEALEAESAFRVYQNRTLPDESKRPLTREDAVDFLNNNASSFRFALIFPEDLIGEDFTLNLKLLYNPQNGTENQIVQGLLQRTLFTHGFKVLLNSSTVLGGEIEAFNRELADLISDSFGGDPDEILEDLESNGLFGFGSSGAEKSSAEGESSAEGADDMEAAFSGMFNIEKEQVFGKGKNPAAQSVGGWAVMFLMFAMTGAASALFEEKQAGLFHRLLAGMASRSQILWSKFLYCAALGLLQMAVLMIFGDLVFDIVTSPAQILPLVIVCTATAAASTAFGMLLSSVASSPGAANGLGTLLILSMSALGGAMFPLFLMPVFMQEVIAPFTLTYWAMDGILAVLWRDAGIIGILPQTGVLLAITAAVLAIALRRFNRGNLFR